MRTSTSRQQDSFPFIASIHTDTSAEQRQIGDLLMLQRASREITSILDLSVLLESVVNNVVTDFGGVEATVWLKDPEREELVLAANRGCTANDKGCRLKIGREGMVGQVAHTRTTYYAPDVSVEPDYIACEAEIASELCIPLVVSDRLIGTFNIAHPEINGFTGERIEVLEALAGHIAIAIENAQIFQEERAEKVLLQREQEEAARIQRELLPKVSPLVPSLRVDAALVPARTVAGDWYDYIALPDGHWAFVLADVSGKGMAAALLMASVRAMLRSLVRQNLSPADVLAELNRILMEDLPSERFVTMILGAFDPETNTIRIANAGHHAPLLISDQGAEFLNTCSGLPLGLLDAAYTECELGLSAGSRLILYTDGITEAQNATGEEFGEQRLLTAAVGRDLSAEELVREACQFAGNGHPQDDATVMVLKAH
jgi:phosphoserine phosphatase RsbU/P